MIVEKQKKGLPEDEAKRLNYYFHFRPPTIKPDENDEDKKSSVRLYEFISLLDDINSSLEHYEIHRFSGHHPR